MRHIQTVVDIAADADTVWSVLANFAAYPDWNPFVRRIEGRLKHGEWLKVTLQPPGMSEISFRSRVQLDEEPNAFSWRGHLLIPGLFTGHHQFHLQSQGTSTRLHHYEQFSGILVPLVWRSMEAPSRAGFEAMNLALKTRAEKMVEGAAPRTETATA